MPVSTGTDNDEDNNPNDIVPDASLGTAAYGNNQGGYMCVGDGNADGYLCVDDRNATRTGVGGCTTVCAGMGVKVDTATPYPDWLENDRIGDAGAAAVVVVAAAAVAGKSAAAAPPRFGFGFAAAVGTASASTIHPVVGSSARIAASSSL
ncbi:hypothetical protein HDU96_001029 [Phlyctochytrium bullatum]|nr:hypothetical protein HDU96_001029 [Phlyctochytrium bullatum]